MSTTVFSLPERYQLRRALFGHGWIDLAPHRWHESEQQLDTAVLVEGSVIELSARQSGTRLRVTHESRDDLSKAQRHELRHLLRHMLCLDEDLTSFWRLCRKTPARRWVSRLGAGRLMRSASLFEDLLKILFTTNCSWAATRGMCQRLVDQLGTPGPTGQRAFPSVERCAKKPPSFWRDKVRTGYRTKACVHLARAFVKEGLGAEIEANRDDIDTCRALLGNLPGFGPYAVGQGLRLLGCYQDLALDSWCRARLRAIHELDKDPTDRWVESLYEDCGPWKGLALWMDLTADRGIEDALN